MRVVRSIPEVYDWHHPRRWRPHTRYLLLVLLIGISAHTANATPLKTLLKALNMSVSSSGMVPPQFNTLSSAGRNVSLNSLQGKVVLISFWATWCRECHAEMPALEQLHRELGDHGLSVLGVNFREGAQVIQQYAKELKLTFPLLLDPAGKIKNSFGVIGLPTTFLIARNGETIGFAVGPRDWERVPARTIIELLLFESTKPNAGSTQESPKNRAGAVTQ